VVQVSIAVLSFAFYSHIAASEHSHVTLDIRFVSVIFH
jgi:hypothetical protein